MGVTVRPIQTINVRVDVTPQRKVSSTATFIGSGNAAEQANLAVQIAQNAYNAANSAIATANTKVSKSGDTMTGSLTINANIAANNANFNTTVTKIDGGTFS